MDGVKSKISGGIQFDLNDQEVLSADNREALTNLSKLGSDKINFTKFNEIVSNDEFQHWLVILIQFP